MDTLNTYLQHLLSSCSDELRLEPDRNPYLVAENRTTDLGAVPLKGTQISTLVFPLIPPDVRSSLPHRDEVEFVLPHNLGPFDFTVQKSPSGFNVTIRPRLAEAEVPAPTAHSLPENVPMQEWNVEPAIPEIAAPTPPVSLTEEPLSDSAIETATFEPQTYEPQPSLEDILREERVSAPEYVPNETGPEIELVSVNDPAFQTVFTETAPEEPLGRRDLLGETEYVATETENAALNAAAAAPEPVSAPAPEPYYSPAVDGSPMKVRMDRYFEQMAEIGASDLHLSVSMPPLVRKDGHIQLLTTDEQPLTVEGMQQLLASIMPVKNQDEFAQRNDTDFAYEIPGLARFRSNIFRDRKGMGAVFRIIPTKMTTAAQLGLSDAILSLTKLSKGLVVVTGPTGSGKSTTLCAMVNEINMTRADHIITIEDPVEFVHENIKCLVNQREVHNHTDSFKDALRAALREDPDILLVGEMRDLETISIAIETAETGHLVFGTLHTTTAASTVDRIIDQFPADRQQQIRVMLSESLKGVIAQTLLPKKGGGRVAALEVLIVTPAISNLIREGKTFQIPSAMQTGKSQGMVMLNDALFEHVQAGRVEPMDAYIKAVDKTGFESMLTKAGFKL